MGKKKMKEWIDENREPKVYRLDAGGITIIIRRIEKSYGWFLSCLDLRISNHYIDTDNLEKAKKEGIKVVVGEIERLAEIKYLIAPYKVNYKSLWCKLKDLLGNRKTSSSNEILKTMEDMELGK